MSFKVNDEVFLKRNIYRREGPYAQRGDTGIIVEIFRPNPTGCREIKPPSAKVKMSTGEIKTFRLTSLDKED